MKRLFGTFGVRRLANEVLTPEFASKLAAAYGSLVDGQIAVGGDTRTSTVMIKNAVISGLLSTGCDVVDLGILPTPAVQYAVRNYYDGGVIVTASHNPPEYNGLKISRENALPVGYDSGLKELEEMVENREIEPVSKKKKGSILEHNIKDEYIEFQKSYLPDLSELDISIDISNGMTAIIADEILGDQPHYIYNELDGTFPNHEANPLTAENREDLKDLLLENNSDIGLIFDGDGDRVMFLDENGEFISPDLIIALLAEYYISQGKGKNILCDIRTSWSVTEHIKELGGEYFLWKVGHAYAKLKLREIDGICGGELAGHYYYKDFFYCDSGMLTALIVLNVAARLKKEGKTISELIAEFDKYASSGEVNFKIDNKKEVMERLKDYYLNKEEPNEFYDFDGYRLEYNDWWFNVRPSNTEPYLRLVVEASTQELLDQKLEEIEKVMDVK